MALPPYLNDDDLAKFRTKLCERYLNNFNCDYGDRCQYSHNLAWRRRNPRKVNYKPQMCPDLHFLRGYDKTRVDNRCKRGRNCEYAHSKEEQMFHPLIYKTQLCEDWPHCPRYYCPFGHGDKELRKANLPPGESIEKYLAVGFPDDDDPHMGISPGNITRKESLGQDSNIKFEKYDGKISFRDKLNNDQFQNHNAPPAFPAEPHPDSNQVIADSVSSIFRGLDDGTDISISASDPAVREILESSTDAFSDSLSAATPSGRGKSQSVDQSMLKSGSSAGMFSGGFMGLASGTGGDMSDAILTPDAFPPLEGSTANAGTTSATVKPVAAAATSNRSPPPIYEVNQTPNQFGAGEDSLPNLYGSLRIENDQPPRIAPQSSLFGMGGGWAPALSSNLARGVSDGALSFGNGGSQGINPTWGPISRRHERAMSDLSNPMPGHVMNGPGAPSMFAPPPPPIPPSASSWRQVNPLLQYDTQSVLHRNGAGTAVYRGMFLNKAMGAWQTVVVKRIPFETGVIDNVEINNELMLLQHVGHPNIVDHIYFHYEENHLLVVLEQCAVNIAEYLTLDTARKDLWSDEGHISPFAMLKMKEMCDGLAHIHNLRIAHRDINPENILLDKNRTMKLADPRRRKKVVADVEQTSPAATANHSAWLWMAPEIHKDKQRGLSTLSLQEQMAADIWGLGNVLFFVISGGQHVYGDMGDVRLVSSHIVNDQRVNLSKIEHIPMAFHLIKSMTAMNPAERPSVSEVIGHPLFWDFTRNNKQYMDMPNMVNLGMNPSDMKQPGLMRGYSRGLMP
eukprot:GILK01000963.1.p1 GENE.GILK01000963.1~~GILK01000963.1.p1  ORF type:complete len:792 (+),score=118.68 GILK01000963.1:80-2455(+)